MVGDNFSEPRGNPDHVPEKFNAEVSEDDNEKDEIGHLLEEQASSQNVTDEDLMFHTPCFGEDEFDFYQNKIDPLKTGYHSFHSSLNSNHSVLSEALFSKSDNHLNSRYHIVSHQGQFSPAPVNHLNNSAVILSQNSFNSPSVSYFSTDSKMATHRDSILESLGNIAPKFPPQNIEIPDISMTGSSNMPVTSGMEFPGISVSQMYGNANLNNAMSTTYMGPAGNGRQSGVNTISPTNSSMSTSSPMRESSDDSDDSVPLAQLVKRQAQDDVDIIPTTTITKPGPKPSAPKKPRTPKKKKKKDPNEPQKPVSAYALFFRDTQAAIKGQNPNATFGEVSKIVASMWEGLDPDHKNVYKKKTEMAKKDYLKQLAAYRASLVSQTPADEGSPSPPHRSPMGTSPQHIMGFNNPSPQHMAAHMSSPQHMGSPMHAQSPQHMASPQHMGSPGHMGSHHMASPQHVPSPQHVSNAQYMASPNHIPSPQQNMFNFPGNGHQPYNSMGYSNGPVQDMLDNSLIIESQRLPSTGGLAGRTVPAGMCIRTGCNNRAIDNVGWDNEYCSNECVVSHCRTSCQQFLARLFEEYGELYYLPGHRLRRHTLVKFLHARMCSPLGSPTDKFPRIRFL